MGESWVGVLEYLTGSWGVEYDPALGRQAVRQAERDVKGPSEVVWFDRLKRAGKDVGIRIRSLEVSATEMIPLLVAGEVLVAYRPAHEETNGQWLVVRGLRRGKLHVVTPETGEERWLSAGALSRLLGLKGSSERSSWALATPLAPAMAHSSRVPNPHSGWHAHGHGHGGGHGEFDPHGHRFGTGHSEMTPIERVRALLRPEMADVRVIVLFAVAVGILTLATPLTIEGLVMTVGFRMLLQQVVVLAILLFFFLALAAAMFTIQKVVVEYIQRRFYVRMVADLSYRLPRVRLDAIERGAGPELVNRFFDVVTVQKAMSVLLVDGVALVLTTIIGLSVMAFYHPYLLGFDLVLVSAIVFFLFLLGRGGVKTAIDESLAKYRTADWLEELARNPVPFKLAHGPELALERADSIAKDWLLARKAHFRVVYRQVVFAVTLQVVASTVLLGLGGWLVIQGQLTLGQLVASELIVTTIVGSFAKIGKYAETYYDLMAGVNKLGQLLDLPMEREGGEIHRGSTRGAALTLREVWFAYHGDHHIVKDFTLIVAPGERVAITGPSGGGKSTLLELLADLRSTTGGQIEFDGMDFRDIRIDALREQIGFARDNEVLAGSILENVRVGRDSISLSQVRHVLERVGLWEEVSALPDEMYRMLSPCGAPLSSGQVRKLMVARAIIGQPRLLLVDEVLDSLEGEERKTLLDVVFDRDAPWTLITATACPEVMERCDRVIHFASPHILEHAPDNPHDPMATAHLS